MQCEGAIRVKEKLGIRCLGEEIVYFNIIKAGTLAKTFEITSLELEKILKNKTNKYPVRIRSFFLKNLK